MADCTSGETHKNLTGIKNAPQQVRPGLFNNFQTKPLFTQ